MLILLNKEGELVNASTGMTQMRKDLTLAKLEEVRKEFVMLGKRIEGGR